MSTHKFFSLDCTFQGLVLLLQITVLCYMIELGLTSH